MQKIVHRLAIYQSILLIVTVLTAWYGVFTELFTHFVPYYVITYLGAAVLDKRGRWLWLALAIVLGFWASRGAEEKINVFPHKEAQTLVFYNSKVDNLDSANDWQVLADEQPDFLALIEVDKPQTVNLYAVFPEGCGTSSEGIFGMVLLAKQSLESCEVKKIGFFPYIRAVSNGVVFYILHPPPPIGDLTSENHQYLAQVAKRIAQEPLPVMVVGDFNQSPYSPSYFRFKRDIQGKTLLVNGLPTWKPFYLHIDHVFVKGLSAQAKELDWLHSDHRPIKVVYLSK